MEEVNNKTSPLTIITDVINNNILTEENLIMNHQQSTTTNITEIISNNKKNNKNNNNKLLKNKNNKTKKKSTAKTITTTSMETTINNNNFMNRTTMMMDDQEEERQLQSRVEDASFASKEFLDDATRIKEQLEEEQSLSMMMMETSNEEKELMRLLQEKDLEERMQQEEQNVGGTGSQEDSESLSTQSSIDSLVESINMNSDQFQFLNDDNHHQEKKKIVLTGQETAEQVMEVLLLKKDEINSNIKSIQSFNFAEVQRIKALKVLQNLWAATTWKNRRYLWKRFLEWKMKNPTQTTDWNIMTFLAASKTQIQTQYSYAKVLATIHHRLGTPTPMTRMFITSLARMGASAPIEQAIPMTQQQIIKARRLLFDQKKTKLLSAVFLAWKLVSRWSDVERLQRKDIIKIEVKPREELNQQQQQMEEKFHLKEAWDQTRNNARKEMMMLTLTIKWNPQNVKNLKGEPNRMVGFSVLEHPYDDEAKAVYQHLNSLEPQHFVCNHPTDTMNKWFRVHYPPSTQDQGRVRNFTTQSIKRGAVTRLMSFAREEALSPDIISRIAKHRHWFDPMSETTVGYVGQEAWDDLAHTLRTQEASRLLL
tara:strand:+ start:1274 stop:3055 length:1782 start_codon:yes stop_codon:yes gene_type:complete